METETCYWGTGVLEGSESFNILMSSDLTIIRFVIAECHQYGDALGEM